MLNNTLKKTVVHFSNHNTTIDSSGRLIRIYQKENNIKTQIKLPFSFPRDFYLNIPLLKRLLRSDAKEVIYDRID